MKRFILQFSYLVSLLFLMVSCENEIRPIRSVESVFSLYAEAEQAYQLFYPETKSESHFFDTSEYIWCDGDTIGISFFSKNQDGFIILDSESKMPIIASDNSYMKFASSPLFQEIVENHGIVSKFNLDVPVESTIIERTSVVDTTMPPLITTCWHQQYPFNIYAPAVANKKAGCTPVAIAQIMAYFRYPSLISLTFPDAPRDFLECSWDLQANHASFHDHDCIYCNNNGLLLREIGQLCHAVYSSGGTAAWPHVRYLECLGYTGSESSSFDYTEIMDSLSTGYPSILCGYDDNNNGHTWVVDGYNTQTITEITYFVSKKSRREFCRTIYVGTCLHFNYGWGEGTDYYALTHQMAYHSGADVIDGGVVISQTVSSFNYLHNDVRLQVAGVHPIYN